MIAALFIVAVHLGVGAFFMGMGRGLRGDGTNFETSDLLGSLLWPLLIFHALGYHFGARQKK